MKILKQLWALLLILIGLIFSIIAGLYNVFVYWWIAKVGERHIKAYPGKVKVAIWTVFLVILKMPLDLFLSTSNKCYTTSTVHSMKRNS